MGWLWALLGCTRPDPLGPLVADNLDALAHGQLSVGDRGLDDALFMRLLDAPAMRDVVRLRAAGNRLGPASARRIAEHPRTAGLRQLLLGSNPAIGAEGLRALAEAPFLPALEELDVSNTGADGAALAALARAHALTDLDASANPVGDDAVPALLALPSLRRLHLRSTRLSLDGLRALLAHPTLTLLEVDGTALGAGLRTRPDAPPRDGTPTPPEPVPPLAAEPAPAAFAPRPGGGARWTLALADTGLTVGELGWLFATDAPLAALDVGGNPLGDAGADALSNAPWLATLETLDADRIGASPEALGRLRVAWGDRSGLTIGD